MGWKDPRGVILSWDGTTPGKSFCPGKNNSRGVILSQEGTTPEELFCPGMERLQGSYSVLG